VSISVFKKCNLIKWLYFWVWIMLSTMLKSTFNFKISQAMNIIRAYILCSESCLKQRPWNWIGFYCTRFGKVSNFNSIWICNFLQQRLLYFICCVERRPRNKFALSGGAGWEKFESRRNERTYIYIVLLTGTINGIGVRLTVVV